MMVEKRMTETVSAWHAAPLVWGDGPRLFEVFLEPTCPHSARAFGKLDDALKQAGHHRVTMKIWLHSQPWHLCSGVVIRCVFAASTLVDGKEAAKKLLAAVATHREQFEPADHCSGPPMQTAPAQVIEKLEEYSGLQLAEAFALPKLDLEMKRHAKYARQNGIHFSPTFMIDGLIQSDMSSGDPVSAWVNRLSA
jgi:hypothetical protein